MTLQFFLFFLFLLFFLLFIKHTNDLCDYFQWYSTIFLLDRLFKILFLFDLLSVSKDFEVLLNIVHWIRKNSIDSLYNLIILFDNIFVKILRRIRIIPVLFQLENATCDCIFNLVLVKIFLGLLDFNFIIIF